MSLIHPTAIVDSIAQVSEDVEIGPYAIIEPNAVVKSGCKIAAHAIIRKGSILEEDVSVDSFAVIGGNPQDFKFDPNTKSGVHVGANTQVREGVTIHRSCHENGMTKVGASVFLMANAHIAHDCIVGDETIIANNVMLAGDVSIGSRVFIGGGAAIHQFIRVGEGVMIGGNATLTMDVAPYLTMAERNTVYGLNLIGLKRRGFSQEVISDIKQLYKAIYMSSEAPAKASKIAIAKTEEGQRMLDFFEGSKIKRFAPARERKVGV